MHSNALDSSAEMPFELKALAQARRYQEWIYRTIEPDLGNRILEIGAGIGNMSSWLPVRERLVLSETHLAFVQQLERLVASRPESVRDRMRVHRLELAKPDAILELAPERLDTIVSFNVLEHIEDDRAALTTLVQLLEAGPAGVRKRLISFVPAHAWAYGEMDRSFEHFRRYEAGEFSKLLSEVAPRASIRTQYFNLFGLAGWVFQGRVLGRTEIGERAIRTFEALCPYIAPVDDFLHRRLKVPFGQSLLAIAEW